MKRKQAREEAFILIFEKVFNSDSVEEILELANEARDLEADDYIKTVFKGVYDNLEVMKQFLKMQLVGVLEEFPKPLYVF